MSRCFPLSLLLIVLSAAPSDAAFDIRDVDFLNFSYQPTLCAEQGIGQSVWVRKGEWNGNEAYYHVYKVIYGDLTGDGREDAVVDISCGPKGANFSESEIHIYSAHEQNIALIARLDDSDLEREYKRYNTNCIEWDDNPTCGVWSGIRDLQVIRGKLVLESLAEGSHAGPKYLAKFTYRVQEGRLVLAQKPQKRPPDALEVDGRTESAKRNPEVVREISGQPIPTEEGAYFDDFSSYAPGSPPTGWFLRGAHQVTPNITEVGGNGPPYRLLDFPEVPWHYWSRSLLKDEISPHAPYTVTVKLNFRDEVADRAGLIIAWNANGNQVEIQPNVYWDDIEFRVTYNGQILSNAVVYSFGHIPVSAFKDYYLRAVVTDDRPGRGRISVLWSTDGIYFKQLIYAKGLQDLTGFVGVSTAGPHLPHVYFDDFSIIPGISSGETFVEHIKSMFAIAKESVLRRAEPAGQKAGGQNHSYGLSAASRSYVAMGRVVVPIAILLLLSLVIWVRIKRDRERQQTIIRFLANSQADGQSVKGIQSATNVGERSDHSMRALAAHLEERKRDKE